MKKRLPLVIVIAVLLSLALVACGDEAASVPAYTGATSITVPDSVKSQFTASMKDIKNTSVEAYKTTDDIPKVKSGFEGNFKSAGWSDQTAKYAGGTDLKPLTDAGMFIIGYQKGNKGAVIFGVPSALAGPVGFSGLNAGENVYMVISGNDA
jgi:hypothetical protein